jgi:hypothetical protein
MRRDDIIAANSVSAASEDFGGEAVIIHFDRGTYFSLGGSGPAIWAMVQQPVTMGGMLDTIRSARIAVASEFETALEVFVAQLLEHDLVRPAKNAAPPSLPSGLDVALFTKPPTLEVFTDLAELIMMDPVHEVDVLEGWPRRPGEAQAKN